MFKKILHFIKFNNAMVLILAIIILGGTGAFAQTETGQAIIGEKQTNIKGIDNALLLEADLNNFNADYKIEHVEKDQKYFYITYTFLDIVRQNNAWQYQIQERIRKVSRKLKKDLGVYIAEELEEQHEARMKDLSFEKEKAEKINGEETRVEVIKYSGLIGKTLDLGGKIFPGYEPIKTREIPSPSIPPAVLLARTGEEAITSAADSLTDVYNDYIERMDPDRDEVFGIIDNCPNISNPNQKDSDDDGLGDLCDPKPLAPNEPAVAGIIEPGIITEENITATATETNTEETATTTAGPGIKELIDEIVNNTDDIIDPAAELPAVSEENPSNPTDGEATAEPDVQIVDIDNMPAEEPVEIPPIDINIEIIEE